MIGTNWSARLRKVRFVDYNWTMVLTSPLADKKRAENGKGHESDDSDRPKKKVPAKTNGKSKGKGKGKA